MRIVTELAEITRLKDGRNPEILFLPEEFRDVSLPVDPRYSYSLQNEFFVEGKATFENKPSRIRVLPVQNGRSSFSWGGSKYSLDSKICIKGNHNIQLGEVKIIEHPLAWMLAFGVYADFELSESSLPTFDYCDRVYIEGAKDNLKTISARKNISVSAPFALVWEKGYCILEPPGEKEESLFLDHQVSYPGKTVGNSRIQLEFTPETFSFFADARTTAFRTKKEAEGFYKMGLEGGLKDYPFTLENVLLLDEEKVYNPRNKFIHTKTGYNFEFICHEIIDIVSWLRFVEEEYEGRFVGKMTTFLFDHHKQIDIAQFVCNSETMNENGLKIIR